MNRREFIAICGGLGSTLLAGCAGNEGDTFEPGVSETLRLGAAESTVLNKVVSVPYVRDNTFEYQATIRANSQVHDYIGSILRDQELLGGGVFLSIEYITADEIEGDLQEEELKRAVPIATVVKQRYLYDEDGELTTRNPVNLDTLREPLPRTVGARTVGAEASFESDRYTAVLPVVVHRYWERPGHD
jgi:hypothetical protein